MQLATHIMFQSSETAEAARFYATLTPDGEVLSEVQQGTTTLARVRVAGHELVIFDSPVEHQFGLTPAMSLFLEVDDASQVDDLVARLSEGGTVLMPVDTYDFAERYGWCVDRFGVSWQVTRP